MVKLPAVNGRIVGSSPTCPATSFLSEYGVMEKTLVTHGGTARERMLRLVAELATLPQGEFVKVIGGHGYCESEDSQHDGHTKFIGFVIGDSNHGFDIDEAKHLLKLFTSAEMVLKEHTPQLAQDLTQALSFAIDAVEKNAKVDTVHFQNGSRSMN
jgi:hypothetical protein